MPDTTNQDDSQLSNQLKLEVLLDNLWYTWNPHYILPIIDLYGESWRKNISPLVFVKQYDQQKLTESLERKSDELTANLKLFREYFLKKTWFAEYCQQNPKFLVLNEHPIAYFCMEYALVDWLQIYSGGLGVLAGDYLKQASDMGVPFVGVGLFYHEGYFHQEFNEQGEQIESFIHQDPLDFPVKLVRDENDQEIIIDVTVEENRHVFVRAWELKVGKSRLILLDTDFDKNTNNEDRQITANLYLGAVDLRIRQEIVLAIAGMRMLQAMKIVPSIFHLNEGHSAFLGFELARQISLANGSDFSSALALAKLKIAFTNHTLKQAGNDVFEFSLFEKYFKSYSQEINADVKALFSLGCDDSYVQGEFSMTILALNLAKRANAVSKIHAKTAEMVWPNHNLVPITNGVHMQTWISPELHIVLDEHLGENWHDPLYKTDYANLQTLSPEKLWETHLVRKGKLIDSLNQTVGLNLNKHALTVAWSRRFVAYKRPDLVISEMLQLKQLIAHSEMPIQIIISGKAHPSDQVGKALLQKMNQILSADEFKNKVVIIPGYNWQLARRMVSGVDVWLNTPNLYEEASGTSGMKASANGVLQLTIKDGWAAEVDWKDKGWALAEKRTAESIFSLLTNEIVPLYFKREDKNYSQEWIDLMRNTMQFVMENYSTERMMKQYIEEIYKDLL